MSRAKHKKVFVAMSGGVDSSVAAFLLQKEGYNVTGIFMRCFNLDGCVERDAEDARRVAEHLGIPFYVFDFEEEYKREVVNYMIEGYRRGITPNPDVMCNKQIKFGLFLKKALEMGADYIATGHYTRLKREILNSKFETLNKSQITNESWMSNVRCQMFSARDAQKDQSYFLWTLTQEQLKHCLFPIGDYLKSEVREMARKAGLPTAEKKDSQGICFLGKVTLADFLKAYIPASPGPVLLALSNAEGTTTYKEIGEHGGAYFYTIGQRHIGIANRRSLTPRSKDGGWVERGPAPAKDFRPLYVVEKDIETNTLVVAEGDDNPALYRKEIRLTDVNFINPEIVSLIRANKGYKTIKVLARVRYRQPLVEATITNQELGIKDKTLIRNSEFVLQFKEPVKFVAPGQSAVFYSQEGELLGGGVIV
jgi:tRNA-specific 2-thiouridylase